MTTITCCGCHESIISSHNGQSQPVKYHLGALTLLVRWQNNIHPETNKQKQNLSANQTVVKKLPFWACMMWRTNDSTVICVGWLIRYFYCAPMHGLFTPVKKLSSPGPGVASDVLTKSSLAQPAALNQPFSTAQRQQENSVRMSMYLAFMQSNALSVIWFCYLGYRMASGLWKVLP